VKIEHIEAMVLKAPVPDIASWRAASFAMPFAYAETTLVKVVADDGTIGWGEVHAPVAPEVTKSIIDVLIAPALLGRDPMNWAPLWDRMHALMRPRGHALGFMQEAISGVDIALHDLAGKAQGVPCYALLGGLQRDRVRVYASVLPWLEPTMLAQSAERFRDLGFSAMKLKVGQDPEIDRAKVVHVRRAIGDDMELMADANCRYTVSEAISMARVLEEYGFGWFEEPVAPEDVTGYVTLRRKTDVAIAGGECESTHYRFADLFARGAFDVAQPDICRAGGLTACHRIGVLADAHGLRIAPHVSIGSALHLAASLHWAASERSVWIHEYPVFDNPLVDDLLHEPLDLRDGFLHVPVGRPGLGVEVREDVIERYRTA